MSWQASQKCQSGKTIILPQAGSGQVSQYDGSLSLGTHAEVISLLMPACRRRDGSSGCIPRFCRSRVIGGLSWWGSSRSADEAARPWRARPRGGSGWIAPRSRCCRAEFLNAALGRFQKVASVSGTIKDAPPGTQNGSGLGPRFNMNSCSGCHAQPAVGGTSPFTNPQLAVATLDGAKNTVPSFITLRGPVREARFITYPDGTPDGRVHDLFVITGAAATRRLQHHAAEL
jgi:hypothetical protein